MRREWKCACPRARGCGGLTYLLLPAGETAFHLSCRARGVQIIHSRDSIGNWCSVNNPSFFIESNLTHLQKWYPNPDPLNQHTANHAHSRSIQSRIPARRRRPAERASVRPTCQVEVPICAAATAAAAAVQYAFQSSAVCLSACHAGRDSRQAGGHGPGQNLCSPYFDSSRKRSHMIKAAQDKCL